MSRSVRTREQTRSYACTIFNGFVFNTFRNEQERLRAKAKDTRDSHSGIYSTPKNWRKSVVKTRRAVDRMEISKVLKDLDYVPNMSSWNCKDDNAWGYW